MQASGFELPIASLEDFLLAALEARERRDVADRAVQPDGIVVVDVLPCHP